MDYYELLGVDRSADTAEIISGKKAIQKAAVKLALKAADVLLK